MECLLKSGGEKRDDFRFDIRKILEERYRNRKFGSDP